MTITTEISRKVYDDKEDVYIEVRPDQDTGECIEVITSDAKSKEWFGAIRFSVDKEFAKALGQVLIDAATESV